MPTDLILVLEKALKKIKPLENEQKEALELFQKINSFISEKFNLQAELMGSVAKDTFIRGDKDLDIFVFFPPEVERKELEKKGLEIGKSVFAQFKSKDFAVSYAEHPYTRGFIKGFEIEIVPAYSIEKTEDLKSAVDRTPFHTRYVQKHLPLEKRDHVRLLKAFLKSIGAYGSDLKTEGFSGYLCELLVIKYGNFAKTLEECQKWHYQQVIDIESHYQENELRRVRKIFSNHPLIFIDPTDKSRNVAAVLSKKQLAKFLFYSRKFFQKPGMNYLASEGFVLTSAKINTEIKKLKDADSKLLVILFKKPEVIDDVLYPQLRKFKDFIMHKLNKNDFRVERTFEFADEVTKEAGVAFFLINSSVPRTKIIYGPSIFNPAKHQNNFIKAHKKFWFEDDRFRAQIEREYSDANTFLKEGFENPEKTLVSYGVPSYIAKSISKKVTIIETGNIAKIKSPEFWINLEPKEYI